MTGWCPHKEGDLSEIECHFDGYCKECPNYRNENKGKKKVNKNLTGDYIKRDWAIKKIKIDYDDCNLSKDWAKGVNFALNRILTVPTSNVKEIIYGKWISDEDGNISCSVCGQGGVGESFCEHCGADMIGEEDEQIHQDG